MMSLIVRLASLAVLGAVGYAVGYTVGQYGAGSLKQLISLVVLYYASVAFLLVIVLGAIMSVARAEYYQVPGVSSRRADHRARHCLV
jgi:aerobic C4-dicarboxylate transport protein